jgi:signal transduction histidine kinase/DNA-binding response OmpR family regulator/tetratricopeptide (TPR) repeat protein
MTPHLKNIGKYVASQFPRLLFFYFATLILLIHSNTYLYAFPAIEKPNQLNPVKKDTTYVADLISLASKTRNRDIKLAEKYYHQALSASRELAEVKFEIKSLTGLGICHAMQDDYSNAILFFNNALALSLKNGYAEYAGDSYNNLGIVYKSLGDYPASLRFYSESLKIYDSLQSEPGRASAFDNIGTLFDLMKEPDKALEHYQKSLAIYSKSNNLKKLASLQSNIAALYLSQKDYPKAIAVFEKNLDYYVSNKMNTHAVEERSNLGYAYYLGKKYINAEHHTLAALSEAEKLGMDEIRINSLYTLAKIKSEAGNVGKSIQLAESAYTIADSSGSLSLQAKVAELLSDVFEKKGDLAQGLKYHKVFKALDDSLLNEAKIRAYKNQQVLLEVSEKDKKLQQQALHMTLLENQILLETRWKWSLALASILLFAVGFLYYQKLRIQKKSAGQLALQNQLISSQKTEIEIINTALERQVQLRKETDETINYFATSLFGKNEVDEILWDVAKNCVARLGFVDCVIYLVDTKQEVLVQKAAYGPKNPKDFLIEEPLEIPLGQGIVGSVAKAGIAEIIGDTSADSRYIVDDAQRFSEITVPLVHQNQVIGVIDSEHPEKNFFQPHHLEALQTIASICTSKIAQTQAEGEARKARKAQTEAEQIKQMDQLKSRFFTNISHEFRTPLHLILAPLQKKEEEISLQEMGMMERNAHRLLKLVNQLLDLAKAEVGMLQMDLRNGNIIDFLHHTAHSFKALADNKGIHYHIDLPAQQLTVPFDPDKLEKIIYNLLSNAIKFTPSGGEVKIYAEIEAGPMLKLEVSDTGLGVPEHLQSKIFDRFYQIDSSQTRAFEGTGIGLALTKELVQLCKGSIRLSSQQKKGSCFEVRLPLSYETQKYASLPPLQTITSLTIHDTSPRIENPALVAEEANDTRPDILLVEDHDELRNYLKKQLSVHFQVVVATQGEEGLQVARKNVPDLIITDIMMPVMDGVTLTRHLKNDSLTSHIPVIMLTAKDDVESKTAGFEKGAEQYLVKPFVIDELLARIHSLLTQRERLRKKYSREVMLQPTATTIPDREGEFLESVMRIINEFITDEKFSVEILQREIGMSRMQLHRKLTALTGQSASDFIRTIRLKKAADLLQQPGIQIAEAAYMSGFSHMSYFSKSFKEQFGVLPSEYVKQPN